MIARAIILNPLLLVADEPRLDARHERAGQDSRAHAESEARVRLHLYITHDLATAKFFCDRIAILYLGRIVEIGPSAAIYEDPKHPYTKALLRAIPEPDPLRSVPRISRAARFGRRPSTARVLLPPSLPSGVRGLWVGGP